MKKFASVLLAVLVAFSMFSFVVSAANPTLTVKTDKATAKAGDTVTATVSVSADSKIAALTVDLVYDATAFEVVSLKKGTTLFKGDNDMEMINKNYAAGKARYIAVATEAPITEAGVVFTVELKALTDAESTIALSVVESQTADADGNAVPMSVDTNSVVINKAAEKPSEKPSETPSEKPSETPSEKPSDDKDPCADGHKWSTWAVTKAATCKEDGVKTRNCTVCGEAETDVIPATGECSYKWVVTKQATATEYGEKVLKCTMCGHIKETKKLALVTGENDSLTNPVIPGTDAIA